MDKRFFYYSIFFTILIGLITGIQYLSFFIIFMYFIVFWLFMIFSFKIYLLFEKGWCYLYEKYFKELFTNIKKTKENIQEE